MAHRFRVARCSPAASRRRRAEPYTFIVTLWRIAVHLAPDLAPHLVVVSAGDHVLRLRRCTFESRRRCCSRCSGRTGLWRSLALFSPGLCRVQTARARDLRAVPTAGLLRPHELVRRVYRLQTAKATRVLRLPRALPLLRVVAARRACLFHAQMVTANRLTRAPVLHPGPRDRLCRAVQA